MKNKTLSKSQYVRGLQCVKSLWLYNHRKDLIPETPVSKQMIFDQGKDVGVFAQTRFPGGRLIEADHFHAQEALESTRTAIESGAPAIYEAGFLYDGVLVRPDILVRRKDNSWDMYEVKSSTEVKDEHIPDVAVQKYVLEGSGIKLHKVFLMRINNKYVRQGDIDVAQLFEAEDITKECDALQKEIKANIAKFRNIVASDSEPMLDIGQHCYSPYECDFREYCWKHIPDYSIYDLPRISYNKIDTLKSMGIIEIKKIPADFDLNASQRLHAEVEKSGEPHIEPENIALLLKELEYPLYFLDFETINPAIPLYDGMRPYQHIVFQASLHVQDTQKSKMRHLEYLGDAVNNPHPGMVKFLTSNIGSKGSIIVYNASFEGTRLKELAEMYPKASKALLSIHGRLWDLIVPFRKGYFLHPDFHCSHSIKAVLPALVPGMTYEGMEIGEGGDAQIAYLNLMSGELSEKEAEKTRAALKKYCGQDTLAMVKLLDVLKTEALPANKK